LLLQDSLCGNVNYRIAAEEKMKKKRFFLLALLALVFGLVSITSIAQDEIWEGNLESLISDCTAVGAICELAQGDVHSYIQALNGPTILEAFILQGYDEASGGVTMDNEERVRMLVWLVDYVEAEEVIAPVVSTRFYVLLEAQYDYSFPIPNEEAIVNFDYPSGNFRIQGSGWSDVDTTFGNALLVVTEDGDAALVMDTVSSISRDTAIEMVEEALTGETADNITVYPPLD
jgi:hypothetical protein